MIASDIHSRGSYMEKASEYAKRFGRLVKRTFGRTVWPSGRNTGARIAACFSPLLFPETSEYFPAVAGISSLLVEDSSRRELSE